MARKTTIYVALFAAPVAVAAIALLLWLGAQRAPLAARLLPEADAIVYLDLRPMRLAATFALALLSYRLFEQPIRHRTLTRPRAIALTSSLGVVAAVTLVAVVVSTGRTVSTVTELEHAAGRASAPAPVARPHQVVVPRVLIAGDSVALTLG